MKSLHLLLIFVYIWSCFGRNLPFDLALTATTIIHYECVRKQYDELGLFTVTNQTGISDASRQCYVNAKSAGLRISVSFTPCRLTSPQQQASDIIRKLGT